MTKIVNTIKKRELHNHFIITKTLYIYCAKKILYILPKNSVGNLYKNVLV